MKNLFVILFTAVLFFAANYSYAQEMDMQEMMKIWTEYMTPGPMHEEMAKNVGDWKTTTSFWNYPGAEPMVSEGTATTEAILGGRYFKTVHKGMVMGMPMEGWSIEAYDNGKKEFINIWFDNMGSGMAISTGKYNDSTATFDYTGTMYDAMSGKDVEFRSVAKQIDENKIFFEMFTSIKGSEFKMMEMVYSR